MGYYLNMKNLKKKYSIKIPKDIKIIYSDKKNLIIFIGSLFTKSLNLKVKLFLIPLSNSIVVTNLPITKKSKVNIEKMQGTIVAKIRQNLIEMTNLFLCKLNLIGTGYRVFPYKKFSNQIYFKLGYSHFIYFKIPIGLNVNCSKLTELYLSNKNSYNSLTKTTAQIKNCRLPEPYKGKGILYDKEIIIFKKGKKI